MAELIISTAPVPPSVPGVEQPVIIDGSESEFPTFTVLVPPPVFGEGGGTAPQFPPTSPDTAPVDIPPGVLVGPVIAAAAVPPSVAGIALIRQVSLWTYVFPNFQSSYPSPPIKYVNTMMIGNAKPPQTATVINLPLGGWGPPPVAPPMTPRGEEESAKPKRALRESDIPEVVEPPHHEEPEEPPPERRRRRK